MALAWNIRYWKDVAQFETYLENLPRPTWVRGLTTHHTVNPTVEDWRGRQTMENIGKFYRDTYPTWTGGPHLFIGPDGIWQGTPLTTPGVHAGTCNATHIGIEVVGNYDRVIWKDPIKSLAFGTHAALLRWLGLGPEHVVGHRDCLPNKSCPGNAISMSWVRLGITPYLYPDLQIIGVPPRMTEDAFVQGIERNGGLAAPVLSDAEARRVYMMCRWLDMDPAALLALWVEDGGRPLGTSPLQQRTRRPINTPTANTDPLLTVHWEGHTYERSQTFQLGWFATLVHLKNAFGSRNLLSARQILPLLYPHAPGDPRARAVSAHVRYMQSHG